MSMVPSPKPALEIPMDLLEKIHRCGAQLQEAQWRAMPPAARQRLVDMPVTNPVERRTFVGVVQWLTETFKAA